MKLYFKGLWNRTRRDFFLAFVVLVIFISSIPIFTYVYFARDLKSKESIMNKNSTGLSLLDREGTPFFNFYGGHTPTFAPLIDIPDEMQEALIVSEDKDFYRHPGFSVKAMLAALVADVKKKDFSYGGSTLTQQLVKNSLLSKSKNFLRKYQEVVLAQEVDRRYSKDEILEMYLNSAYFGEGAFGVEQASQVYFGKDVKKLNLAESSFLVGILPAPSELSPYHGNLEKARSRQQHVLSEMVEKKVISQEEADKASNVELAFKREEDNLNSLAPHFALMVRDELIKKYGEERVSRSGFQVKTTLDPVFQSYAEKVVEQGVNKLAGSGANNGAATVIDPKTGQILVLVGSKNWYDEEFGKMNMVTSPRQPGSSFKPIVYLAALEDHVITPSTLLKDEPTTFKTDIYSPEYKPKDYDGKYRGPVTTRRALSNSLNIPSVQVMSMIGVPRALDMAENMGITTLGRDASKYGYSLVLGAGEVPLLQMTSAYSILANNGVYNKPVSILEITDKSGRKVFEYKSDQKNVVDRIYTFLISSILMDSNSRAEVFGDALNTSVNAAVKTGTTDDYRDAWTLGYTEDLAVGVWVGNNDNKPMDSVAGSLGAAPIWRQLIEKFSAGKKYKPEKPDGVVALSVCKGSGLLIREATSSAFTEYFANGTQPTKYCTFSKPSATPGDKPSASPEQTPSPERTEQPEPTPIKIEIKIPQGEPRIQIFEFRDNNESTEDGKKKE